jgi:hypothetical protein
MRRTEVLSTLVDAAEQVPPTPRIKAALAAARKAVAKDATQLSPSDYQLTLANTSRALDCIADGLRWASEMRASGQPVQKIMPIVQEQNRRALRLLEARS